MIQFINNNYIELDSHIDSHINSHIDSDRYSRQSYTIGQEAQVKLSGASVLVIGYNSIAQEITRNLILIGVYKIDIHHSRQLENYQKTGLYYPIGNDNQLPLEQLRKLNPSVNINSINILDEDKELDKKKLKKYNLVILTNSAIDDAININRIVHKLNIPFIMCGTYGLMGYLFNDFGDNFTITDIDGEIPELLILDNIDGKNIKFKDEHKLFDGDVINITLSDGTILEYNVYRKTSPLLIELVETPNFIKNDCIKIIRKKVPQNFSFELLKRNLDNITHITADWSVPPTRTKFLHMLHMCYDKYLNDYGKIPRAWSISDFEVFEKYLDVEFKTEQDIVMAKKFCYTLRGDLLPIASIMGGVVAHEVLKVLTHKYIPITQWYYMDYLDLILDSEIIEFEDNTGVNYRTKTKYEGIVNVFGKRFLNELQNTIPFVIGSGAIGCELVKNLGMMGIKQIYLTDPDHIEKSNLSRQFLFNDSDIRQSKAETASKKIKLMNPDINVNVLKHKICPETENIFDTEFHSKIDIYLNALDNVDARIYMDNLAIKYSKPLIDSGTMGSKGNIQVIIPNLTESYGSSKDPDEKSGIPICTIKSFPYKPEHTIQWARELFETEFNEIPNLLNKYKNIKELNILNDSDSKMLLKQLYKYGLFELKKESYLKLLYTIYQENYYDNIKEIVDKYSKEENKDELGDKKLPNYIDFNNFDLNKLVEYFSNGFVLLNQVFKTNIVFQGNICEFDKLNRIEFTHQIDNLDSNEIKEILYPIINLIPKTFPIEFEKDDDTLCHVSWITLSANLRNIQYSIPECDLFETRRIAGNIIPAMITTTSLISGFQILEFIRVCKLYKKNKYINGLNSKEIDFYKSRFVNLNTNYYDGINPLPPKNYKLDNGEEISLWTNFITENDDTDKIIEQIQKQTNKKIEFMTMGNMTIFDGDEINISKIDKLNNSNILLLLEDIPIGIPLFIK